MNPGTMNPGTMNPRTAAHDSFDLAELYRRTGLWHDIRLEEFLDAAVREMPHRIAIVDRDRSLTYAELGRLVDAATAGLHRLGIGPGDVVSWILPSWAEAIVIHHAAIRLGGISNPIIPIYRHREVRFILAEAQSKIVVCPQSFRGFDHLEMVAELSQDLPALEHIVVVGSSTTSPTPASAPSSQSSEFMIWEELLATEGHPPIPSHEGSANDRALLLYTSGTTADPKGALHSQNTLEHENRTIINLYGLTTDDVVFMPSPLAHITGVLYGIHLPVMLMSTVVLQDIWDTGRALDLLEQHRATFVVGATPFLHGLTYHHDIERRDLALRSFACGGADVPAKLIVDATERLQCCATRVYGSTEYPTVTGSGPADRLEKRANTDGRVIGVAETRIVDDDDRPVPSGEAGELLVRGPEMFLGYLDERLNETSFRSGGWFATGDLVSMDEDGYIRIVGRKKDIIIRGGENLSVKEIEDLIFEHPAVHEVAVVGMPDPLLVERVCAYVVAEGASAVTLQDLIDHLTSHRVAKQKLPERLELVAELPKTASGKVQKHLLRTAIRAQIESEFAGESPANETNPHTH